MLFSLDDDEPSAPPLLSLLLLSAAIDSAAEACIEREGVDERRLEEERRADERLDDLLPELLRLALLRDFEPLLLRADDPREAEEREALLRLFDALLRLFEAVPRDALLRLFDALLDFVEEARLAPLRAFDALRVAFELLLREEDLAGDLFAEDLRAEDFVDDLADDRFAEDFLAPPRDFELLALREADFLLLPPRDFEDEERDLELLFFEEAAEERVLRFFAGMGVHSFHFSSVTRIAIDCTRVHANVDNSVCTNRVIALTVDHCAASTSLRNPRRATDDRPRNDHRSTARAAGDSPLRILANRTRRRHA